MLCTLLSFPAVSFDVVIHQILRVRSRRYWIYLVVPSHTAVCRAKLAAATPKKSIWIILKIALLCLCRRPPSRHSPPKSPSHNRARECLRRLSGCRHETKRMQTRVIYASLAAVLLDSETRLTTHAYYGRSRLKQAIRMP